MNDQLASLLWAQIWQISILIIVVSWLAGVLARRSSQAAYLLWIVVVIKCLTPPLWSSEIGVFSWSQWFGTNVVNNTEWADVVPWSAAAVDDPTFEDQLNITVPEDRPRPVIAAPPSMLDLTLVAARDLLLFGWGLGLLACFVISWRKWSDFKYDILQSQVETPAWFETLVAQVADSVRIHRRIKIIVTEHPAGPLMMGTWRPTLVVPSSLLHEETSHRLRPIVAHELVHARRADTVIGWLQTIAQWIWWFHPLVWWANRQTTRFCETSCDDEVIARLNCRPRFYAACLLDLLEGRRIPEQSRVALSGIRLAAITRQRLDELIHRPKMRRAGTPVWGWTVALLIAVMALPGAERLSRADQVRDTKLDLADQAFSRASWAEAVALYSEVVEEDEQQGRAWFRLGYALHVQGELDLAIEAHQRAAAFEPLRSVALYNWACALSLKGERDAALAKLEAAIAAGFRSLRPIERDPDLFSLKDDPEFQRLAQKALGTPKKQGNREFDFLIGRWRVFDNEGSVRRRSTVSIKSRGYVLAEAWTTTDGNTGTSLNYFDPSQSNWHQTRVDGEGRIFSGEGKWAAGQLALLGRMVGEDGTCADCRVTYRPCPNGCVKRLVERRDSESEAWQSLDEETYQPDTNSVGL